jgi:AcrR family transcriptional regulator
MIQQDSRRKVAVSKRGRPPGSNAQKTREKLLRSAANHFSTAEYSEVSLSAIAAECGITGGAIYNHFESKAELFKAVAEHMMRVNGEAIDAAIAGASCWRSMLRSVLNLMIDNTTGWFRFPLLIPAVQIKMMREPENFAPLIAQRAAYVARFKRIVDCAIAEGDLPIVISRTAAAELLLAFTFNGMGAVMAYLKSEEEINELVNHTSLILCAISRK